MVLTVVKSSRLIASGTHVFDRTLLSYTQWLNIVCWTCEFLLEDDRTSDALVRISTCPDLLTCPLVAGAQCPGQGVLWHTTDRQIFAHSLAQGEFLTVLQCLIFVPKAYAAERAGEHAEALRELRVMCGTCDSQRIWNLFYTAFCNSTVSHQNIHRFIQRLQKKAVLPFNVPLSRLSDHQTSRPLHGRG